jgi:hypothetical protein
VKDEGTMSLKEAYFRGATILLASVGAVFAVQFLQDLYRYLVHGKTAGS